MLTLGSDRVERDGSHDVGGHEELEPQQERFPEVDLVALVGVAPIHAQVKKVPCRAVDDRDQDERDGQYFHGDRRELDRLSNRTHDFHRSPFHRFPHSCVVPRSRGYQREGGPEWRSRASDSIFKCRYSGSPSNTAPVSRT